MKYSNIVALLVSSLQVMPCLSSAVSLRCSELVAECLKATTIQQQKCYDMASSGCIDIFDHDNSSADDVSEPLLTKRYGYAPAFLGQSWNYGNFAATLAYLQDSPSGSHLNLGSTNTNLVSTIVISLATQLVENNHGLTGGSASTTINSIRYALQIYGAGVNVDSILATDWEETIGPILDWGVQRSADIVTARLDISAGVEWVATIYRI